MSSRRRQVIEDVYSDDESESGSYSDNGSYSDSESEDVEDLMEHLSIDKGTYCVGFIHQAGARASEIPIRVFATNNVGADRKTWQNGSSKNLKTYSAIYCDNGNADTVVAAWEKLHESSSMGNGWYKVTKTAVSEFVSKFDSNDGYKKVSEAKAKLKKRR